MLSIPRLSHSEIKKLRTFQIKIRNQVQAEESVI